jgi:hypothetical protein
MADYYPPEILTALAVQMAEAGATTLSDTEARATVSASVARLRQQGQIASTPEPGANSHGTGSFSARIGNFTWQN